MGNGHGLKPGPLVVDIETSSVLTMDDISAAALKAQQNFGQPNQIFMGIPAFQIFNNYTWTCNPEFEGLPWAQTTRLTVRERKVAQLHMLLFKLGIFKKFSEEQLEEIKNSSIKRLKRAKWAKYQKRK